MPSPRNRPLQRAPHREKRRGPNPKSTTEGRRRGFALAAEPILEGIWALDLLTPPRVGDVHPCGVAGRARGAARATKARSGPSCRHRAEALEAARRRERRRARDAGARDRARRRRGRPRRWAFRSRSIGASIGSSRRRRGEPRGRRRSTSPEAQRSRRSRCPSSRRRASRRPPRRRLLRRSRSRRPRRAIRFRLENKADRARGR